MSSVKNIKQKRFLQRVWQNIYKDTDAGNSKVNTEAPSKVVLVTK